MTEDTQFMRVGHVEVYNTKTGRRYDFSGLDFKFKITRSLNYFSAGFVEAEVLNISQDVRDELTAIRDLQTNVKEQYRLRIYAGYRAAGAKVIADCDLCEAMPITAPPEIWMRFKGVYGYLFQFANVSVAFNTKEMSFRELCDAVVDKVINAYDTSCHTRLKWRLPLEKGQEKVTGKDGEGLAYKGTVYGVTNYISSVGDVSCFFDMGEDAVDSTKGTRLLVVHPRPSTASAANSRGMASPPYTKQVDVKHGLIGLPQFKPPCEVSVTTLLDSQLRVWDKIDLKSSLIPQVNGEYAIKKLTMEGHLRGREWYSKIVAYDQSRVAKG